MSVKSMAERIKRAEAEGRRIRIHIPSAEKAKQTLNKIARSIGIPKVVQCRVCYKRTETKEAIFMEGGGAQGHKDFWMCLKHR